MTRHVRRYWTHWAFSQLPEPAGLYAGALSQAMEVRGRPARAAELVAFDSRLQVVSAWLMVPADDIGAGVDRAFQRLWSLVDAAGLGHPGRIDLLAGRLGRAPRSGPPELDELEGLDD